jgi:hypothetical protein
MIFSHYCAAALAGLASRTHSATRARDAPAAPAASDRNVDPEKSLRRLRGSPSTSAIAGGIASSDCSGSVAALLLHNPHDRAVPMNEGERARDVLLGRAGDAAKWVGRRVGTFECRRYGYRQNPLFWCLHAQDVIARGRYYPHQWPEGVAQGIIEFFDLVG